MALYALAHTPAVKDIGKVGSRQRPTNPSQRFNDLHLDGVEDTNYQCRPESVTNLPFAVALHRWRTE
jgi:hypothetical protein